MLPEAVTKFMLVSSPALLGFKYAKFCVPSSTPGVFVPNHKIEDALLRRQQNQRGKARSRCDADNIFGGIFDGAGLTGGAVSILCLGRHQDGAERHCEKETYAK